MTPTRVLTVIIVDGWPISNLNSSATYRSVQIELTPEQSEKLKKSEYESIDRCFIEPQELTK